MRNLIGAGVISLALVMASGCATSGAGYGDVSGTNGPVTFSWKSKDGMGISGSISALLPNGNTFSGTYFQITSQTAQQMLVPLWSGWNEGWTDWPYWGPYPVTQFVTVYSGKVVANLQNPNGKQMRCRFHLANPMSGMSGGGQGECQTSGGKTISAMFPPS